MKFLLFGSAFLLSMTLAHAQVRPTAFEAYAQSPTAKTVWSNEAGRLTSTEATLVVTAVVIQDAMRTPSGMKGLRLDLSTTDGSDRVYIAAHDVPSVKQGFDEISANVALFKGLGVSSTYIGAAQFWHPDRTNLVHTTSASFHTGSAPGITLSTYGPLRFRFPGHTASEFSALFQSALTTLNRDESGGYR